MSLPKPLKEKLAGIEAEKEPVESAPAEKAEPKKVEHKKKKPK